MSEWDALLLQQPTQSKFFSTLHKVMNHKKEAWITATEIIGQEFKDAHDTYKKTLDKKLKRDEQNLAILLFVLDIALIGATAYVKAAMPKSVVAPKSTSVGGGYAKTPSGLLVPNHVMDSVGKAANGKTPGTLRDFVGKTAADLSELMEQPWVAAAAELGKKGYGGALDGVKKGIKKSASPIVKIGDDPLGYHQKLSSNLKAIWLDMEKILIRLGSPPVRAASEPQLPPIVKAAALSAAKATVFWNEPPVGTLRQKRDTIEQEFERCLWALWMRTRWDISIDQLADHGTIRYDFKESNKGIKENEKRAKKQAEGGILPKWANTDISNVGGDVAKRLEDLKVTIGGKKPTSFMNWGEYDSETRQFIEWGEGYAKKPKETFGTKLPPHVIYPWANKAA